MSTSPIHRLPPHFPPAWCGGWEGDDKGGIYADLVVGRLVIPMRWISPDSFTMGSPQNETGRYDDELSHTVILTQGFWLGRYPVTQEEFEAVMGKNPSHFKGPRRPVENVEWDEAVAYCRRLTEMARELHAMEEGHGFRLPTEAEWEYACRAGTINAFNNDSECTQPTGHDPALDKLGWFDQNSRNETHPVGEKQGNAWGLHDMHGNVWEWCEDRGDWNYQESRVVTNTYREGVVNPVCLEGAWRVVRGGSCWNDAGSCRSAVRNLGEPGNRDVSLGFRLAAGLISQEPVSGAPGPEAGGADAPVPEAPRRRD
jgi:sulfatase modifying factor 1